MATPMPQQPPFCPTCGAAAVWHAPISQWGCDRCRQMLPGQAPLAPAMAPPTPQCPRCGTRAIWHPSMNHWGCDVCREMLPVVPVMPVEETSTAVTILLRIVMFIVSVGIIVAIKLAFR